MYHMQIVERQFIDGCKKKDAKAQEWMYNQYAPVLMGICLRYFSDKAQAEDALHEGMLIVFTKIRQYQYKGSFEGWLKRIIVNKCLDTIKKQPKNEELKDFSCEQNEQCDLNTKKEKVIHADFSEEEILETIQNLPVGFRTVFNLYIFEDYKHREIAKKLNISVGTSKSQLNRAREKIQENLYRQYQQKESKKEKKIVTASLLFMTTDDLKYVDNLVKDKLKAFKGNPGNGSSMLKAAQNIRFESSLIQYLNGIFSYSISKILLLVTVVASVTLITLDKNDDSEIKEPRHIFENNKLNNKIEQELLFVMPDSIKNNDGEAFEIDTLIENKKLVNIEQTIIRKEPTKKMVVDTVKVEKRKVIRKQRIFVDTIKRRDTLKMYR